MLLLSEGTTGSAFTAGLLRPPPPSVGTLTAPAAASTIIAARPLVTRPPPPESVPLLPSACSSSTSRIADSGHSIAAPLPISVLRTPRTFRSRPCVCPPRALPRPCPPRVPPLPLHPWLRCTRNPSARATSCSICAPCSAAPTRRHSHKHLWPRSTASSQARSVPCSLHCHRSSCSPRHRRSPRRPPLLSCCSLSSLRARPTACA